MGVTGGTPVGFNVGTKEGQPGSTLPGIDLGVRGMKVGGVRKLLVPPNLAYGNLQVGEILPNSTLTIDLELLSIKTTVKQLLGK
jgi:FKBP-type peptidyl-prolyl cis-trans isomerase